MQTVSCSADPTAHDFGSGALGDSLGATVTTSSFPADWQFRAITFPRSCWRTQANRSVAFGPCLRATAATDASASRASVTNLSLSPRLQKRLGTVRRPKHPHGSHQWMHQFTPQADMCTLVRHEAPIIHASRRLEPEVLTGGLSKAVHDGCST